MWYASLLFLFMLGSIPTGLVVATLYHDIDPREAGSGNIGMTNIWRVLGWEPAALTLAGDLGKGFLGICLIQCICDDPTSLGLAAAALVLGHCYSAFLEFSGGKGVATTAGVLLALHTPLFVAVCLIWVGTRAVTGKSSLSALLSAGALLPLCYMLAPEHICTSIFLVTLICWRHRDNIQRLKSGQE